MNYGEEVVKHLTEKLEARSRQRNKYAFIAVLLILAYAILLVK
jgi:hypothetical protein